MYKVIIILVHIISLIQGDYYEILGVSRLADQDEIRKAFKKLAIIYHPDKNTDPNAHDKFIRLTTAYEVLKDNDLRKKYDLYGEDFDNSHKKQTYHSWSYYQNDFDIYEDDQYVINLENNDFKNVINSESSWFVNFYSPRCSHCHDLAPIWKEVAKLLDGIVNIAAVNCQNDKSFCNQLNIRAYPTLLYYKKNSRHGIHYMGKKTQDAIMQFVLDGLDTYVPKINATQLRLFLLKDFKRKIPMLILICNEQQNCLTPNDRFIIAAKFDKLIDVKLFTWKNDSSQNNILSNTHAIYLPVYNVSSWKPVFFDGLFNINILIEQLLNQLPSPQELTENDFMIIKETKSNVAWLIYFYLDDDDSMVTNLQVKKLNDINLGKINCRKNKRFCTNLGLTYYPIWGMLKPGGAFELNHGKSANNDVFKFAQLSMKTTNVWALDMDKVLSILQGKNEDEMWFLDWYTPWCPPCINFLRELRIASLQFNSSVVRFGTIDCTVYVLFCSEYNIRYYPTAMLIDSDGIHKFKMQKTAANVIHFINEKRDLSVVELTVENFFDKLGRKKSNVMWIIDYFVTWCVSCQKLMPEWKAAAKALRNLSFVNVGSMDCEIEAKMCTFQGINSFPSIRLYPLDSEGLSTFALYNGQRDSLSILTWITSFFPKKIRDLNPSDYQKALNSKHIWIVNFYLPQCWDCQKMEPEFAIASHLLEKVKFGRINCNFYMRECAHVKIFPTLILYDPKQKINNGIKINATTAETIKDKILHIINLRLKHDEL